MSKFKFFMKQLCLVCFGLNLAVMGFSYFASSFELFLLGAMSSVLVLYGYLYGYNEDD